jgi:hypothetical protein
MKAERIEGTAFRKLMEAACRKLEEHKEQVNALNVFPVPDGDTGSNMSLTMQAALDELAASDTNKVGALAQAAATGALMGSRGNSGVILSQLFRGFASELAGKHTLTGQKLAAALEEAADTAYANLLKPVEGTILTVARETAEAAAGRVAANPNSSVHTVFEAACEGAEEALESTPNLLPVLEEAGVVDAGGQGLVWLLRGMKEACTNLDRTGIVRTTSSASSNAEQALEATGPKKTEFELTEELGDISFPYDTELLLRGQDLALGDLRQQLEELGDSVLVVGDSSLAKVHVHTDRPDEVLSLVLSQGNPYDILIKDMRVQYDELENNSPEAGAVQSEESGVLSEPDQLGGPAVVAVASGEGFSELFLSLGARAIIPGGQTMNPSTRDIIDAVEEVGADPVIVLPNNSNVILSCSQAQQLTDIEVMVVPTRSMAEGVIALLALRPGGGEEENVRLMTDATADAVTGEVTYAVRDTAMNGVQVQEGDIIGMCNHELCTRAEDPNQALIDTIEEALFEGSTLVSVYVGAEMGEGDVEPLWAQLEEAFPQYDVEVQYGGQPHYYYVFSVE